MTLCRVERDNVSRVTWHCVADNMTMFRGQHDTVSRGTWHCRTDHDNMSHRTWQCFAGNMTLCRMEHDNMSRGTWQCFAGNMTLCRVEHDNVSRATWHCGACDMTLCRVEHDERACCCWMQALYILIEHNLYRLVIHNYVLEAATKRGEWYWIIQVLEQHVSLVWSGLKFHWDSIRRQARCQSHSRRFPESCITSYLMISEAFVA
jgi:hypothetical protein